MPSAKSSLSCANAKTASCAESNSPVRCRYLGVTPCTMFSALLAANAAVAIAAAQRQPLAASHLKLLLLRAPH
jgi:hypothetical protein